ncbi:MAG: hypothetical protein H0T80_03410 [Betaproteobacteria bacterium]|nr:hypothetical protein [Betaproteobacteria bacterium]
MNALGLGEISEKSGLGQPLRVVVPVIAAAGETLADECFRLIPAGDASRGDNAPSLLHGRITLQRTLAGARLVITTPRALAEPAVRLTLQAGCDRAIERQYTLLLDPVTIDAPATAASRESETTTVSALVRASPKIPPVDDVREDIRVAKDVRVAREKFANASTEYSAMSIKADSVSIHRGPAKSAAFLRTAVAARLDVSRTEEDVASHSGNAADPKVLSEALEAETVVLRQRIAELTGSVERMRGDLSAMEPTRELAQTVARPTQEIAQRPGSDANALSYELGRRHDLIALGTFAALLGAVLVWKRRRSDRQTGEWPLTGLPSDRFETTTQFAEASFAEFGGGGETPEDATLHATKDALVQGPRSVFAGDMNNLDVADLSHVTEEARVYLALNHIDRAMGVLLTHIREQPNSVPAAWLMLLDLYRTHGREEEFRKLAPEFHRHFNAQTPQWDRYPRNEPGDQGLEAFPRVIKQLGQLWGTPDAQRFLDGLLYDNRNGRRMGFSLAAYNDILTLRQLSEVVLADIDADLIEEQRVRIAFAAAAKEASNTPLPVAQEVMAAAPRRIELEFALDEDSVEVGRRRAKQVMAMEH